MKTNELTGKALDWAVHQARFEGACHDEPFPSYSTDWAQGGPIVEREGMGLWAYQWNEQGEAEQGWYAEDKDGDHVQTGPTPLIAAMRCYVASKLGEDVSIPEELA
jgi:hypothetical protein